MLPNLPIVKNRLISISLMSNTFCYTIDKCSFIKIGYSPNVSQHALSVGSPIGYFSKFSPIIEWHYAINCDFILSKCMIFPNLNQLCET